MSAPLSDRERLARELFRWSWDMSWATESDWTTEKAMCFREADRILKMVCGSCGLAIPLMGKGKK